MKVLSICLFSMFLTANLYPKGAIDSAKLRQETNRIGSCGSISGVALNTILTSITGVSSAGAITELPSEISINVSDFGVVGDSATDNTTALRAVFAMAVANKAWVYFPAGNYLVSDTINIPFACKITGNGGMAPYYGTVGASAAGVNAYGNSVIIQTSANKSAFVISHDGCDIQGITIKCTGASPTAGAGIRVVKGNSLKMQNVFIGNFYSNLVIESGVEMNIGPGNQFVNPIKYNISVAGLIGDEGDNVITGNMFNSSLSPIATHIYITNPAGLRINNNKFHIAVGQNVTASKYPLGAIDIYATASTSTPMIIGNSIEAYTRFGLRIRCADATVGLSKVTILGNQFEGYGAGGKHDIDIKAEATGRIAGVSILDNNIGQNGLFRSIYVENVRGVTMAGNTIAQNDSAYSTRSDSIVNCTRVAFQIKGVVLADSIRIRPTPVTSAGPYDYLTRNSVTGNIEKFAGHSGIGLLSFVGSVSSYNNTSPAIAAIMSDETGSGAMVFGTSPVLKAPAITDVINAGSGALAGAALDISQTWNTTGSPVALKVNVTNTASAASAKLFALQQAGLDIFSVRPNGQITWVTGGLSLYPVNPSTAGVDGASGALRFAPNNAAATVGYSFLWSHAAVAGTTQTTGDNSFLNLLNAGYAPVSGTGTFAVIKIGSVINQAGGASGITRGIWLNNRITSAADWRAIEITPNTGYGIYQAGAAVKNLFGGNTGFGAVPLMDKVEVTGNFALMTPGNKIKIATGSNSSVGTATLAGGTVMVNTTVVSSTSKIYYAVRTPGGTQGFLSAPIGGVTDGICFIINSTSATETSAIDWWIIN